VTVLQQQVIVTYLHHSGYMVSGAGFCMIFDYVGGESALETQINEHTPGDNIKPIALASHAHGDHFGSAIVKLANRGICELVLSSDIKPGFPANYISPGQTITVGAVRISAYGSTDQGVSFLAEVDGIRVFHAGDLNLWHWRDQSTDAEVRQARRAFEAVMDTLPRQRPDIAFFPVDKRLGAGHDEGAVYYATRFSPRYLFPMHWWDDVSVPRRFAENAFEGVNVTALTKRGESITL